MENFRINRKCPLCPQMKSDHVYKTAYGLYRHIFKTHVLDEGKKLYLDSSFKKPRYLRVFSKKYSKFRDIPIFGKDHAEAIAETLCRGEMNPTLRLLDKELLEKLTFGGK